MSAPNSARSTLSNRFVSWREFCPSNFMCVPLREREGEREERRGGGGREDRVEEEREHPDPLWIIVAKHWLGMSLEGGKACVGFDIIDCDDDQRGYKWAWCDSAP